MTNSVDITLQDSSIKGLEALKTSALSFGDHPEMCKLIPKDCKEFFQGEQ